MSDTGDDSSDHDSSRKTNSRKIVMKIKFDEDTDDEAISDSGGNVTNNHDNDEHIQPSCSHSTSNSNNNNENERKTFKGKRRRVFSSSSDEDDSINEITKSAAEGKKLRKAIIIDDENNQDNDSNDGDDDDDDEEDNCGFVTDSSNDDTYEKCPICLISLRDQEIGTPETCDHIFCATCIQEWSRNVRTCPIDRQEYEKIIIRESFHKKNFIREINIEEEGSIIMREEIVNIEELDRTYCEICGDSNREDIMLLCDGCNQGYHMDCLTPPLNEIPDGYWYCDNCFESEDDEDVLRQLEILYEDLREMGIPESSFRIREHHQPRILRTRQSERIRAVIVSRTRRNARTANNDVVVQNNSSQNQQYQRSVPSTSGVNRLSNTTTRRKRKRRSTRRRRRTYIVEYDVNNFDQKFELKSTKKYIRRRRKTRKNKSKRSQKIIQSLRIPNSRTVTAVGTSRTESISNPLDRFQSNFSIFGNPNELEYFSDASDNSYHIGDTNGDENGGLATAIQTSVRLRGVNLLTRRKRLIQDIQPPIEQSSTIDVLSSIMDIQDRWHNASQRIGSVRIESDGTLNFEEFRNSNNNTKNKKDKKKKDLNENDDVAVSSNDIVNAPLYPRGGGGNQGFSGGGSGGGGGGGGVGGGSGGGANNNYTNRYNNQSNYRGGNSGNNSGQYNNRNSTGGFSFSFNSFRRDNFQQQDNNFQSNVLHNTPNNRNRFNRNQNQQSQQNQLNQQQRFDRRNLMPFPNIRGLQNSNSNQNQEISSSSSSNENLVPCSPHVPPPSIQTRSIQQIPPPIQPLQPTQQIQPLHPIPSLQHMQSVPPPMSIVSQCQQFNKPLDSNTNNNALLNLSTPPPVYGPMPLNYFESHAKKMEENVIAAAASTAPPPPPPLPDTSSITKTTTTSTSTIVTASSSSSTTATEAVSSSSAAVPPLAPPPWNNNLFRLTDDYGGEEDDDDDSNCPNFSVYSAESFQVARSSDDTEKETSKDSKKSQQQQEDDYDDKAEDLIQLGDDDDIPTAIHNDKKKDSNDSDIYEPENPTDEIDDESNNDNIEIDHKNDGKNENDNDNDDNNNNNDEENRKNHSDDSFETTTTLATNENDNENLLKSQKIDEDSNSHMNLSNIGSDNDHDDEKDENDDDNDNDSRKATNTTVTASTSGTSQQPFNRTKKLEFSIKRRNVLELYDDSDWEEWNIEKPMIGPKTREETERSYTPPENDKNLQKEKQQKQQQQQQQQQQKQEQSQQQRISEELTENVESNQTPESVSEIEEPDRSYTPCLDEKTEQEINCISEKNVLDEDEGDEEEDDEENEVSRTPAIIRSENDEEKIKNDKSEVSTTVIDGLETELISEGEDEEILNQDHNTDNKKKSDKISREESGKKIRKEQFKKISKNTKERNYRGDKEREKPRQRSRSRSRSRDRNRRGLMKPERKRVKRKEIERYDVRNVINQPRTYKDRYGRDTSRPPRSRTRSRSRSHRRRSRSLRSFSHSRSRSFSSRRNHSFSISPSPESFGKLSQRRRRSFSPRRSRSPRRRSRSPPIRRRSRTPLRIRSRSNSRSRLNGSKRPIQRSLSISSYSKSLSKSRSRTRSRSRSRSKSNLRMRPLSPKNSRSLSLSPIKRKRKHSKDRKKKKTKKRQRSLTPSPQPSRHSRQSRHSRPPIVKKKKKRIRTTSQSHEQAMTWSPSPPPPDEPMSMMPANDASWTPPLLSPNHPPSLRVVLNNDKENISSKKKKEKKKKSEKRRDPTTRKEKRKRRSEMRESPIAPSKEVFASGDNILVSVSFNKEGNIPPQQQTTVVTLPPTREEIISKRRTPEKSKKQKKVKEKTQRRHKKIDTKPVAIIDLDRSPFQVIQSPRDVIVLTDSDHETENRPDIDNHNNRMEIQQMDEQTEQEHICQLNTVDQNMSGHREENIPEESFECQQLGPKTPPEPPLVKFTLSSKNKQVKTRNPLHDEQEEMEDQPQEHEEHDRGLEMQNTNKIGPNTPPESGPCSPDIYDPFDPTKSPSGSPSPPPPPELSSTVSDQEHHQTEEARNSTVMSNQEKNINPVDLVMALMSSKTKQVQETSNTNTESQFTIPGTGDLCNESHEKSDDIPVSKGITVVSNVLITPGKSHRPSSNIPTIASPISKTPQSMSSQSIISKLPLPKIGSSSRQNGSSTLNDDTNVVNEIESPYSPGSEDYEDLFEPPPNDNSISLAQLSSRSSRIKTSSTNVGNNNVIGGNSSGNVSSVGGGGGGGGGIGTNTSSNNKNSKIEMFDNLFGSTSPVVGQVRLPTYTASTVRKQRNTSNNSKTHKKTPVKVAKMSGISNDEQIKVFDELPNSAVEMQVKDKFLRKLYRQERVVDEVKLVLKPHYIKKHISKEDYKEILRRAVPKICHSRSGEINPKKIQNLIEAYVKKFRQRNKLGIGIATGQVSSAVKCAAYLKKL